MRLTTLLEKEKEIFEKTKDLEEVRTRIDTKKELENYGKSEKDDKNSEKRASSLNFEEVFNFFCFF